MRGKRARYSGGPRSLAEVDTRVGSEAHALSPSKIISIPFVDVLIEDEVYFGFYFSYHFS